MLRFLARGNLAERKEVKANFMASSRKVVRARTVDSNHKCFAIDVWQLAAPNSDRRAQIVAGWARRDFEARRMLNTVWRFALGDMGGVALLEIFPKGRSRRLAGVYCGIDGIILK